MLSNKVIQGRIVPRCAKSFCKIKHLCHAVNGSHKNQVKRIYGQPTAATHPHLLQAGEVTPGIKLEEYQERRLRLMELVIKTARDSKKKVSSHIILVPSSSKVFMSYGIPYAFRQNKDFLYLSGSKEPEGALLLHTVPEKTLPIFESVMFIPQINNDSEKWEGPKTNIDGAIDLFGVHSAHHLDNLRNFLENYVKKNGTFLLWYDHSQGHFPGFHQIVQDFLADHKYIRCESPIPLIHSLRLIKSPSEVELMKKSCKIISEAMSEVMCYTSPSMPESEVQGKLEYEVRRRGAEFLAFPPVVAGGSRANTIHYISNDQILYEKDTVLVDAGCEFHGYCSDIARTWPVSGTLTPEQRSLYELVLSTQEELIALCSTFPSLDHIFMVMCQLLGKKLQEIGIIPMTVSHSALSKVAYTLCPHHVGHYLGMDVHDTNLISRNIPLQPGMVITIEPGLYIKENDTKVPTNFRGLCIRVEDDILITKDGPQILTSSCPKKLDISQ